MRVAEKYQLPLSVQLIVLRKFPLTESVICFFAGEASAWSGTASPTLLRDHDPELDHPQHHQKQSVLNKVKEKARRWRHSLSKKKHGDTVNATPTWGVSLEEEDYGEEDPEYLGAPSNILHFPCCMNLKMIPSSDSKTF